MKKQYKKLLKKNKIIVIASVILIVSIATIALAFVVPDINNNIRKDRIISIMNSLKLDNQKYNFHSEYIQGKSMTMDSTINKNATYTRKYTRNSDVYTTLSEIQLAADSAGLIYVNNPNPNSAIHTIDYKTTHNEYIRFYVSSKLRDDAFYNNPEMSQGELTALDKEVNSAPANILIKINLDGIN